MSARLKHLSRGTFISPALSCRYCRYDFILHLWSECILVVNLTAAVTVPASIFILFFVTNIAIETLAFVSAIGYSAIAQTFWASNRLSTVFHRQSPVVDVCVPMLQ